MKILMAVALTAALTGAAALAEPATPAGSRLVVGVSGMH